MKQACVIFNANAGSAGRIKDLVDRFAGTAHCELCATAHPGDAAEQVRTLVARGTNRVVVAGGDGTISEVVNGLAGRFDQVELAFLPLGTGNDLTRSLGVASEHLDRALTLALEGDAQPIDVIRMTSGGNTQYIVNAASAGLGGKVAADVDADDKRTWGAFAYWMTGVRDLVQASSYDVSLQIDDRTRDLQCYGVAVANGRFVGGGFPIAPQARLDDGLLDVTLIPALPAMEMLAAGLNFMLGVPTPTEAIETVQASHVTITTKPSMLLSLDGELSTLTTATFDVLPGAIRVVPGRSAVALQRSGRRSAA